MATISPAAMLGWDQHLGSVEAGKLADLIVVAGTTGRPHTTLVDATEADLSLVVINGVARVGTPTLMNALGAPASSESILVAGQQRVLNLSQADADPTVAAVSVANAETTLAAALAGLADHRARPFAALRSGQIRLAVDGLVDNEMSPRPHLLLDGQPTGPNLRSEHSQLAAAAGLPPMAALTLDPLTAIDNPAFYTAIAAEGNLPTAFRDGLATYAPARSPR